MLNFKNTALNRDLISIQSDRAAQTGNLQKWLQRKGLSWKHFTLQELEFEKTELLYDNKKHLPLRQKSGSNQYGSALPVVSAECGGFAVCFVSRIKERAEQRLTRRGIPPVGHQPAALLQPIAAGKIPLAGGPATEEQSPYLAHVLNSYSLS